MLLTTVRRLSQLEVHPSLMAHLDARGHYTIGKEMVDSVIDRIRRVAGMHCQHSTS